MVRTLEQITLSHFGEFQQFQAVKAVLLPGPYNLFQTNSLDLGSDTDVRDVNQLRIQLLLCLHVSYVSRICCSHRSQSMQQNIVTRVNKV